MNPFDGVHCYDLAWKELLLTDFRSYQAADAGARLYLPIIIAMRPLCLSCRRVHSILRILSYDAVYDDPIYSNTVYGVRVDLESHEP